MADTQASSTCSLGSESSILSTPTHDGNPNCYSSGCREPQCREAHRVYETEKRRARRRPDSMWDNPLVDPTAAQKHIIWLRSQKIGTKRLSVVIGLSTRVIDDIYLGKRKKIQKNTERKILACMGDPKWVDPTPARNHLLWLQSNGIGLNRIRNATGIPERTVGNIRRGTGRIRRDNADKILALGLHMFHNGPSGRPHLAIAALSKNSIDLDRSSSEA